MPDAGADGRAHAAPDAGAHAEARGLRGRQPPLLDRAIGVLEPFFFYGERDRGNVGMALALLGGLDLGVAYLFW